MVLIFDILRFFVGNIIINKINSLFILLFAVTTKDRILLPTKNNSLIIDQEIRLKEILVGR